VDHFQISMVVLGALLIAGALISARVRRSFLSLTAIYVLVGFVLGRGGFDILGFTAQSPFVKELAIIALVVILFRDGLEVDGELLQKQWHLPLRKLVVAMPITAVVIAAAGHWIVGLGWIEALLLGSLLCPTDPVLSSSVVTNPKVPKLVRNSLNLESGLNDGLALPPVIAFSALLASGEQDFVWWRFLLEDVTIGLAAGVLLGLLASVLLPRPSGEDIPAHQKVLFAIGVALGTYGVLALAGHGNPFIAVYVCAITLGLRRPDIERHVEEGASELLEIVKLGIFVVFGSILTLPGLIANGWAAGALVVVVLLVARPVSLWVALVGTRPPLDRQTKAFMAWFGPKGVATMTYSIFVLTAGVTGAVEITNLAALCVLCSILAHGLTDGPGSEAISRHAARERERARAEGLPAPAAAEL